MSDPTAPKSWENESEQADAGCADSSGAAAAPRRTADKDRLLEALERLARDDPTFRRRTDEETGEVIIAGMGELHLEVLVNRLRREHRRGVAVGPPRVAYRQTLKAPADIEARHIKQSGGHGQYGVVKMRLRPVPGREARPDALRRRGPARELRQGRRRRTGAAPPGRAPGQRRSRERAGHGGALPGARIDPGNRCRRDARHRHGVPALRGGGAYRGGPAYTAGRPARRTHTDSSYPFPTERTQDPAAIRNRLQFHHLRLCPMIRPTPSNTTRIAAVIISPRARRVQHVGQKHLCFE